MSAPATTTTPKKKSPKVLVWAIVGVIAVVLGVRFVRSGYSFPQIWGNGNTQQQTTFYIDLYRGGDWKEIKIPPQHRIELSATKNAVIDIRINHNHDLKTIGPGRGYIELGADVENIALQLQTDQSLDTAKVCYEFKKL